ncbi:MAG: O-antigen ligase family protein [Candidatus Pacebacteria bacterium]|nr:O-antigen ligase family protein [Candidatus Paceibacterota bacterium]
MNFDLKTTLATIVKGGLFIVPFLPLLIVANMVFPYIGGKAFAFRLIVEISFAIWVWLAIFYKEYRPKLTPLLIAVGLFIFIVVLATIFGIDPAKSFWSNFERMEGTVTYLHLAAYFLVLSSIFNKSEWNVFFNLFIAGGLIENFYVFLQKIGTIASLQGGSNRMDGTIGNPAYLAAYLIFVLFFCLWGMWESKQKLLKYLYSAAALWTLVTIYFTATRGATIGLLGGLVIFGILYLVLKKSQTSAEKIAKKTVLFVLAGLFAVAAIIWLFRAQPVIKNNPVLGRLTNISLSERVVAGRFAILKVSWEGFKERPILGWGPENYLAVFSKHYRSELWWQEPWFDRTHNIVLEWLINAGILGLLSYLGIFAAAFYLLWKSKIKNYLTLETAILISVLLAVYFMQNVFIFDNIATYSCFFAVLAFINFSFSAREEKEEKNFSAVNEGNALIAAAPIFILLASTVYFLNIKPYLTNTTLLNSFKDRSSGLFEESFDKIEKALDYNIYLGRQEILEQLGVLTSSAFASKETSDSFKNEILQEAISRTKSEAEKNQYDIRTRLFLSNLYATAKMYDKSLEILNEVLAFSYDRQQIYFEIADVYVKMGNYKEAVVVSKKAFDLDPNFDMARVNLAGIYILNGQQKESDALLMEFFGTTEVADNLFVQVYSKTKDYKRLAGIWRAFVAGSPTYIQYRKNLAGAYLLAGDGTRAIQELEEAVKIDPTFKEEADMYIEQIKQGKF